METKDEPIITSYDDFEPFCKWRREEDCDTLELHVPGFIKEHMRVHISRQGIITIAGDRPIDDSHHRRSRFHKEIKVSRQCKADEVRVKLDSGILYVILPKKNRDNSYSNRSGNSQSVATSLPSSYLLGQWNSSSPRAKINRKLVVPVTIGVAFLVALGAFVYNYYQLDYVN